MKRTKWAFEKLQEEALKYKTRKEFEKNSPGAYQAAIRRSILDKICSHMGERLNEKWTKEELEQEASKYKTRKEFEKNSSGAYHTALRRSILDKICPHMEYVNYPWTDEELQQETLKYKTRGEFQKNSKGAYCTAQKRKILDKICSHMVGVRRYWTDEELVEEAKKYKSRKEFQKNSKGAYAAARRRKILDKISSHMKTLGGTSKPEIELFGIIKSVYPKTLSFKIRSKRKESLVEGKLHIKGFDIDIYIPELRKGIEFDGTYWHSASGLKRQRNHWPEEDVVNYHKIKNRYFKSKGIKILHIKEKDWKKDKQACIDKCLEFLGA
jgi:hypothetical protein